MLREIHPPRLDGFDFRAASRTGVEHTSPAAINFRVFWRAKSWKVRTCLRLATAKFIENLFDEGCLRQSWGMDFFARRVEFFEEYTDIQEKFSEVLRKIHLSRPCVFDSRAARQEGQIRTRFYKTNICIYFDKFPRNIRILPQKFSSHLQIFAPAKLQRILKPLIFVWFWHLTRAAKCGLCKSDKCRKRRKARL